MPLPPWSESDTEMEHTYLLETDAARTASPDYRAFISTIRRVIHDEGAAVTHMRISVDGTPILERWPAYDGPGARYRYLPECTDDERGIITVLMGWMQLSTSSLAEASRQLPV